MNHTVEGFDVGGKAHRMLLALERGPQPIETLYDIADATTHNRREKVRFILRLLETMSAIHRRDGQFSLLPAGVYLLEDLDAPRPTVRIFTKETA
jgi:predicted transcriptional regulator